MSWIQKYKNVWRIAILVVAAVAMTGPWLLDVISVPAEYSCSAPYVRLDGDFCGIRYSVVWFYVELPNVLAAAREGVLRGGVSVVDWARLFLVGLLPSLFLLPFCSTFLLVLRGDRRRLQVLHLVAWGLAGGLGMLLGVLRIEVLSYPRQFWVLWGLWLYVGTALGALILEVLRLTAGRRVSRR